MERPVKKIRKSDYMTMEAVAERLGCKPDALAIVEAIERLKKRAASKVKRGATR